MTKQAEKNIINKKKHPQLVLTSDHAGFKLKEFIKKQLTLMGIPFRDEGPKNLNPDDDYPILVSKAARGISQGRYKHGIAICGTGIGASITANKFKGVRASLCLNSYMAALARRHNDANMLVLGGRITSKKEAAEILKVWLSSQFEGGRHKRRVQQLNKLPA